MTKGVQEDEDVQVTAFLHIHVHHHCTDANGKSCAGSDKRAWVQDGLELRDGHVGLTDDAH